MKTHPLALADFVIQRAFFEVRYPPAYLIWDRHGALWSTMVEKLPELAHVSAEPGKTVFDLGRDVQLSVQLELASVAVDEPKSLDQLGEISNLFLSALTKAFGIASFSRVGFRIWYLRRAESQSEAVDALLATGLITAPSTPRFGVETKKSANYALRLEDDKAGTTVRLHTDSLKIEFKPPFGNKELETHSELRHGVILDVDHYLLTPVPVGQLLPAEWLKQAYHVVKRDLPGFLGR